MMLHRRVERLLTVVLAIVFSVIVNFVWSRMRFNTCRGSIHVSQTYTVCTYFEPVGMPDEKDYQEILEIWGESWAEHGWTPRILNEKDAAMHPNYHQIKKELLKLPTVNNQAYEISCYMRWVAAVAVGCTWMSDIDMINYGFPAQPFWKGPKLISFEGHTPSLVTGNSDSFQAVVDLFLKVAADPTDKAIVRHGDRNHTSDMLILSEHREVLTDVRFPAHLKRSNPALHGVPLVHFARGDTVQYAGPQASKAALARSFRGQGQPENEVQVGNGQAESRHSLAAIGLCNDGLVISYGPYRAEVTLAPRRKDHWSPSFLLLTKNTFQIFFPGLW